MLSNIESMPGGFEQLRRCVIILVTFPSVGGHRSVSARHHLGYIVKFKSPCTTPWTPCISLAARVEVPRHSRPQDQQIPTLTPTRCLIPGEGPLLLHQLGLVPLQQVSVATSHL